MKNEILNAYTDMVIAKESGNTPQVVNDLRIKYEMLLLEKSIKEWKAAGKTISKQELEMVVNQIKNK